MEHAKGRPMSPEEILSLKEKHIPPEVFDAFNELIAKNFNGSSATVSQPDVVELISEKMPYLARSDIYSNNLLDVEDIYRKNGWSVYYDKPGYNESYDAYFVFKPKT